MTDNQEELPFEGCCDLIERELRNALKDITDIRDNKPEAKRHCFLLRVALANARHYLLELETHPVSTGNIADDLDAESETPRRPYDRTGNGHSLGFPHTQPKRGISVTRSKPRLRLDL